jgi:hypothetical protein
MLVAYMGYSKKSVSPEASLYIVEDALRIGKTYLDLLRRRKLRRNIDEVGGYLLGIGGP